MSNAPVIDTLSDGEDIVFDRRYADTLYYADDADITVSDDGRTVTVNTQDNNGHNIVLTYKLNQVFVDIAEYDEPDDEVTATTAPASTEHVLVYGDPDAESDADLIFDGTPISRDHGDFSPLWTNAGLIEAEEDYIAATGIDENQDPIPNQYSANWLLVEAAYEETPEEPFFRHPKYTPE